GSSAPVRLSGTLVAGGDVASFVLSPDGMHVVYHADAAIDNVDELFTVPADGSAPARRLHQPLTADQNGWFQGELFTPDSSRVLFISSLGGIYGIFARDLYCEPSDGSAAPVRLNPPLPIGFTVKAFALDPLSQRAVYLADENTNEVFEL